MIDRRYREIHVFLHSRFNLCVDIKLKKNNGMKHCVKSLGLTFRGTEKIFSLILTLNYSWILNLTKIRP